MQISVSEAKAQLTDLVRRAEAGDEVILTRHGQPAARLVAVQFAKPSREEKLAALDALQRAGRHARKGPDAAHSADFLYDDYGMPA